MSKSPTKHNPAKHQFTGLNTYFCREIFLIYRSHPPTATMKGAKRQSSKVKSLHPELKFKTWMLNECHSLFALIIQNSLE